ncbi:MAG TPA: DNA-processing protein DprA [Pyrinomonadaceae bacterium]
MREWIALNMTPGVGPRVAAKLLERFGSAEAVFGASRAGLEAMRLQPETIESIIARELFDRASAEVERVREMGADILLLDDGVYPALLREIFDPPVTLYVKGAWEECLDQPCVAMVGSRRCSTYGQNAATMLARDLASRGVTIISGLARGIDAASHRGALEAGGRTVAVMGTGLDQVYPRDHKKLAEEILARGGAVVSEFPLESPPSPQNFPYRNRVISGLSLGVVVVEAAENSGSLITARMALEQGREVYAVPGNITSKNSFGTNYLIKGAGAKLVQQWQDVKRRPQRFRTARPSSPASSDPALKRPKPALSGPRERPASSRTESPRSESPRGTPRRVPGILAPLPPRSPSPLSWPGVPRPSFQTA